jgi:hypothetical protein
MPSRPCAPLDHAWPWRAVAAPGVHCSERWASNQCDVTHNQYGIEGRGDAIQAIVAVSIVIGPVWSGFWPLKTQIGPGTGHQIPRPAHTRTRSGPVNVIPRIPSPDDVGTKMCY